MSTTISPPSPNNKASAYGATVNHVKHRKIDETKPEILVAIVDNR
jgi:hypothetical protein